MRYIRTPKANIDMYPKCRNNAERLKLIQDLFKEYKQFEIRKKEIRKRYSETSCIYCGDDDLHLIMLHDNIWKQVNPDIKGWVCIPCMEKKLKRSLTVYDVRTVNKYKDLNL
jgi:hypothetical protein